MKKFLLSTALSIAAMVAMAQYPCVEQQITVTGNNGNGGGNTCASTLGTYHKDGEIVITFSYPATEAPTIDAMYDLSGPTPGVALDVKFSAGILAADGKTATYCYYSKGASNINLVGGANNYRFEIHYSSGMPCSPSPITLPVKLKSFNATRNQGTVNLTWVTSTEQNNRGFELQRMIGGGEWKTVAFIFTQADDGNSATELSYNYPDANTYKGLSQYRLMQVNLDNKVSFSQVRSVRGEEQQNKIIISPNPSSNGHVNVVFDDAASQKDIMLSDAAGRLVKKWNNYTDNSLQISGLQTGFYQLSIVSKATGIKSVQKIVVTGN